MWLAMSPAPVAGRQFHPPAYQGLAEPQALVAGMHRDIAQVGAIGAIRQDPAGPDQTAPVNLDLLNFCYNNNSNEHAHSLGRSQAANQYH